MVTIEGMVLTSVLVTVTVVAFVAVRWYNIVVYTRGGDWCIGWLMVSY